MTDSALAPTPETLSVLVSTRAVLTLPDDSLILSPATISISQTTGKIVSIVPEALPPTSFPSPITYVNYGSRFLLPGLVDAHVHLNEPGRTEWEGFATGTRAAASGGVTTVIDMPLNAIPPTTTVHGFEVKLAASIGQCWVDVGFYGGVVPGNADQLVPLVKMGARGFKGFLIDSGVELAMRSLAGYPTTLMFHAEMIPPITSSVGDAVQASEPPLSPTGELTSYGTFLDSRPPVFETCAIEEILSLAHLAPQLHLHVVHLSATECIPILKEARKSGVNITAETCFHYLGLAAEDVEDGDTRHKCCPPIRSQINQDGLWEELCADSHESAIKTVVSDHSPCTPELKLLPSHLQHDQVEDVQGILLHSDSGVDVRFPDEEEEKAISGDFFAAWGGISSVGLGLPILHTTSKAHNRPLGIVDIVRLCSQATAAQAGLSHRKGGLKVGLDADVCVFDDAEEWTLECGEMHWKNRCSPWESKKFVGRVRETWLRGQKVFEYGAANGGFVSGGPVGEAITEERIA
ncbi:Allantoinase [Cytospora paraplurivora]|uniref:Allantoinase n=1 Tax=Cytospora paraplurivora TaxID=2898453 RepID=A0AAN9U2K9_9PEZI